MSHQPLIDASLEKVICLADEIRFAPQSIVSRTVLNTPSVRVTLFGFAEGQELTEHTSTSTALVQILSGECDFALNGTWHHLKAGDFLHMPANLPHALKARTQFSMLLTLCKTPTTIAPQAMPKLGEKKEAAGINFKASVNAG